MKSHSPSYTQHIYDPSLFPLTAHRCCSALWAIQNEIGAYDFIAGCGNSSVPLLGAISMLTGIPYVAVRKKDDASCHDDRRINGPSFAKKSLRYVFVDDLISSGNTYYHVWNTLRDEYGLIGAMPECIAACLYDWTNRGEQRTNDFVLVRSDRDGNLVTNSDKSCVYDKITAYHAHFFD